MRARLDRITDLERRIGALQAEQVEEAAAFVTDRLEFDERQGYLSDTAQHRGIVAEMAIAKKVSVTTAERFLADAHLLTHRHPRTLEALRSGGIGLPAARAIATEACVLNDTELV